MKLFSLLAGLAAAALSHSPAAADTPRTKIEKPGEAQVIAILFDPPLDQPVRFRSEKVVEQKGKSEMTWAVEDFVFEKAGEGYRVKVVPVDSGIRKTDAQSEAVYKKLAELSRLPYVLTLSEDAEIVAVENEQLYWKTISDAIEAAAAETKPGDKPMDAETRKALAAFVKMFKEMPAENRLGLLTKGVQPLVEFGNTELTKGETISAELEGSSPFGGTIKREVHFTLQQVKDGIASISVVSSIPGKELEKVVRGLMDRFPPAASAADRSKRESELSRMAKIVHETSASYQVSLEDGLPLSYLSTETVQFEGDKGVERRVTTQSLTRIH